MQYTLPEEMKYEILRWTPNYRRVNKPLYQDYNHRYCDAPIKLSEFLNFIRSVQVEEFDLYYLFIKSYKQFSYIEVEKDNEGKIHIELVQFTKIGNQISINTIVLLRLASIAQYVFEKNYYFDLYTTTFILKQRPCQVDIENYLYHDVSQFRDYQMTTFNEFFDNLPKYLYYLVSRYGAIWSTDYEQLVNLNDYSSYHILNDEILQIVNIVIHTKENPYDSVLELYNI